MCREDEVEVGRFDEVGRRETVDDGARRALRAGGGGVQAGQDGIVEDWREGMVGCAMCGVRRGEVRCGGGGAVVR